MKNKKRHHREDIKAAIRKRGLTLRAIGIAAGLHRATASYSLLVPIPKANRAIAEFLGKSLHELWPDWYDKNGERIPGGHTQQANQKSARRPCKKSDHKFTEHVRGNR